MAIPSGINEEKESLEEILQKLKDAIEGMTSSQKNMFDATNKSTKFQENDSKERKQFYESYKKYMNESQKKTMDQLSDQYEKMEKYLQLNQKIIEKQFKNEEVMLSFIKEMGTSGYRSGSQKVASGHTGARRNMQDANFGGVMMDWIADQVPAIGMLLNRSSSSPGSATNRAAEQGNMLNQAYTSKYNKLSSNAKAIHALGSEEGQRHINMTKGLSDIDDAQLRAARGAMAGGQGQQEGKGFFAILSDPASIKKPAAMITKIDLMKLPSAFSAGSLYVGSILEKLVSPFSPGNSITKELNAKPNISGGSGGGIGGLLSAIGPVGWAAIIAGIGLTAVVSSLVDNENKRTNNTQKNVSSLTPQQVSILSSMGLKVDKVKGGIADTTGRMGSNQPVSTEITDDEWKEINILASGDISAISGLKPGIGDRFTNAITKQQQQVKKNQVSYRDSKSGKILPGLWWKRMAGSWAYSNKEDGPFLSAQDVTENDLSSLSNGPKFSGRGSTSSMSLDKNFSTPQKYHTGGVVPGRPGDDIDITAQAGEFVTPKNTVGADFSKMHIALSKLIEQNNVMIEEMKKNTEVTDKKELKVEIPNQHPSASRQTVQSF